MRSTYSTLSKKHYELLVDWKGMNYCGLTFNWNYDEGYVDVSMPGYVSCALAHFNHTKINKIPTYTALLECTNIWPSNTICK